MTKKVSPSPNINPERLKNLLKELLDIYSPSGKEEEIIKFVTEYLSQQGLNVIQQQVDENRFNVLVLPEDTDEIDFCFIGHLDTVSAYDLDEYGFEEEDGMIFGVGAADMKSGCAAMIEAFTALSEAGITPPQIGLALVVGEEVESDGAKTLMREYSFPWAIVGEPTDLVPCLSHYGYLEVLLRTRGKRAHSSMPELGRNAIEPMLQLLLQVTKYATSAPDKLVYNIRQLSGFPGAFVVPDSCEAWLDLHLPPESRMDVLKAELENLVEAAAENITELDAYIRFEETYSGYRISEARNLVKKLKSQYKKMDLKWEPMDFRSHSDGNILWASGTDPIILGPGQLELAHSPEEAVPFEQVSTAAKLYLNFALSLGKGYSK